MSSRPSTGVRGNSSSRRPRTTTTPAGQRVRPSGVVVTPQTMQTHRHGSQPTTHRSNSRDRDKNNHRHTKHHSHSPLYSGRGIYSDPFPDPHPRHDMNEPPRGPARHPRHGYGPDVPESDTDSGIGGSARHRVRRSCAYAHPHHTHRCSSARSRTGTQTQTHPRLSTHPRQTPAAAAVEWANHDGHGGRANTPLGYAAEEARHGAPGRSRTRAGRALQRGHEGARCAERRFGAEAIRDRYRTHSRGSSRNSDDYKDHRDNSSRRRSCGSVCTESDASWGACTEEGSGAQAMAAAAAHRASCSDWHRDAAPRSQSGSDRHASARIPVGALLQELVDVSQSLAQRMQPASRTRTGEQKERPQQHRPKQRRDERWHGDVDNESNAGAWRDGTPRALSGGETKPACRAVAGSSLDPSAVERIVMRVRQHFAVRMATLEREKSELQAEVSRLRGDVGTVSSGRVRGEACEDVLSSAAVAASAAGAVDTPLAVSSREDAAATRRLLSRQLTAPPPAAPDDAMLPGTRNSRPEPPIRLHSSRASHNSSGGQTHPIAEQQSHAARPDTSPRAIAAAEDGAVHASLPPVSPASTHCSSSSSSLCLLPGAEQSVEQQLRRALAREKRQRLRVEEQTQSLAEQHAKVVGTLERRLRRQEEQLRRGAAHTSRNATMSANAMDKENKSLCTTQTRKGLAFGGQGEECVTATLARRRDHCMRSGSTSRESDDADGVEDVADERAATPPSYACGHDVHALTDVGDAVPARRGTTFRPMDATPVRGRREGQPPTQQHVSLPTPQSQPHSTLPHGASTVGQRDTTTALLRAPFPTGSSADGTPSCALLPLAPDGMNRSGADTGNDGDVRHAAVVTVPLSPFPTTSSVQSVTEEEVEEEEEQLSIKNDSHPSCGGSHPHPHHYAKPLPCYTEHRSRSSDVVAQHHRDSGSWSIRSACRDDEPCTPPRRVSGFVPRLNLHGGLSPSAQRAVDEVDSIGIFLDHITRELESIGAV